MTVADKQPYGADPVSVSLSTNGFNSSLHLVKNEGSLDSGDKLNPESPYDPYEHRAIEHPNGFFGAFIHIVKTSLGTGILAIPRAFKNAGLIVGFFGAIIVGFMCTHAVSLLVKSSLKICQKTKTASLGYADTAEGVFKLGPPGVRKFARSAKIFVEGGLFLIHFLADSVYLVFISISLTQFFVVYFPGVESWGHWGFKLILLGPLLICGQVKDLKNLVPFSFIANVMLLVAFGITGYYVFSDIGDIDVKERHLATSITGIPSFFSTVLFSMEGIGTIMPVENSMNKAQFLGCPGVLNMAMTVVISLYTSIGFIGYYKFGEDTEATIMKNLPKNDIPAQVAQIAIAIAVFFSFMLVFYVPVDILWSKIKHRIPNSRWNRSQMIIRTVLILIATGIAIAGGENLGLLIDLIGAILLSMLGLFVPACLDIIADWDEGWGIFHWRLIKDILFMVLSTFGMVCGVYYALAD